MGHGHGFATNHLLYDLRPRDPAVLDDLPFWRTLLDTAAREAGATILHVHFHRFEPQGLTGFLLLAESHISVHTWPEGGCAAVDVFTCGEMDAEGVITAIRAAVEPTAETLRHVPRKAP